MKKIKTKWTVEIAEDLEAYHSIDAEEELTKFLIEELKNEMFKNTAIPREMFGVKELSPLQNELIKIEKELGL